VAEVAFECFVVLNGKGVSMLGCGMGERRIRRKGNLRRLKRGGRCRGYTVLGVIRFGTLHLLLRSILVVEKSRGVDR
jgi:hypothetical protein